MIDRFLEGSDLSMAHTALALIGFFLAVYVMQLTQYQGEDGVDPPFIRALRRISLAVLAWALLWSVSYAITKGWQPWPAELMMILGIDGVLLVRALAIRFRVGRTGQRVGSAAAADMPAPVPARRAF